MRFAIAISLLALAGCAGYESQTYEDPRVVALRAREQEVKAILARYEELLQTSRTLDPIRAKISLSGTHEQTFEMLSNQEVPTPAERKAILEWAKLREALYANLNRVNNQYHWLYASVDEAEQGASQATLADLYNSVITYGQFAKRRAEIVAQADSARQQIYQAWLRQNAAEQARAQQAALQALQLLSIQRQTQSIREQTQVIQDSGNQTRGRTTQCTVVGNSIFCN